MTGIFFGDDDCLCIWLSLIDVPQPIVMYCIKFYVNFQIDFKEFYVNYIKFCFFFNYYNSKKFIKILDWNNYIIIMGLFQLMIVQYQNFEWYLMGNWILNYKCFCLWFLTKKQISFIYSTSPLILYLILCQSNLTLKY